MMTMRRTFLLCAASVLLVLSLASPAVGSFWDNQKEEEPAPAEDHTVKLSHHSTTAASENKPVEYGVDVVSPRAEFGKGEKSRQRVKRCSLLTRMLFLK